MQDIGSFATSFGAGICLMLTLMYVASLVYKYAFYRLSAGWKEFLFILLAVLGAWLTMRYGFRFSETVIFDLRLLAIIAAPMFVRRTSSIAAIGLGVGLARLSFGWSHAALVGFFVAIALGLVCFGIDRWARSGSLRFTTRMSAVVVGVNAANIALIATFGVVPTRVYLRDVAPMTFGFGLALSFLFVFILRDFVIEARRKRQLEVYNSRLEKMYRVSRRREEELREAQKELERKNEEVMSASRYKSEFLANMSHELRTPLNSMLVLSQLLEDNPEERLSDEEVRYASVIHASGKELLRLINDVLDLSKIEAGRLELNRSLFGLSELLGQLGDTFEPLAGRKGLAWTIERQAGLPEALYGDEQRIQQIVQNLAANAVKFTDEGSVALKVFRETEEAGEGWLAFMIEDTGIGIPESQRDRVFEAFYQVDGTTTRAHGGTGLGLSICRQYAELMGGRIGMDSEAGEGSRFTLYLPWAETVGLREGPEPGTDAETDPNAAARESGAGGERRVVLIVDDDEANVYALRSALESSGLIALCARGGLEAIRVLDSRPDVELVLMDVMMPEIDGLETIRRIRRDPRFGSLPIVAVTAGAFEKDREACLLAGADDYASKPVELKGLLEKAANAMVRAETRKSFLGK